MNQMWANFHNYNYTEHTKDVAKKENNIDKDIYACLQNEKLVTNLYCFTKNKTLYVDICRPLYAFIHKIFKIVITH